MEVRVWRSYSSNNSSDYRLVARFKSAEIAGSVAKELKGFLAEHARQVDESGDIDNPSEAQQELAKRHRFEWVDSPLCWGDEALSGDEPSVASADEMLVLYHTYCGGFDELSPYLKARGATIEDQEREPPTVLFRFKLPSGKAGQRLKDELGTFFAQADSGQTLDEWKEPPWGGRARLPYAEANQVLWFSDRSSALFFLPIDIEDLDAIKGYLAERGVRDYRLRLCDDSLTDTFRLLSNVNACPACGSAEIEYLEAESSDLPEDQICCHSCDAMFALSAVESLLPVTQLGDDTIHGLHGSGDTVVVVSGTYGNGKIRRRIGDGAWEVVKQHRGGLRAAYCITDKRFIVTGTHGTIYLSTDGGSKWTKKKSNTDHCLFCASSTPDGTIFIAGDSGLILRSRDKCKSFEHLETKTNKMLYNVGAASDKLLFCVGHGGLILRSKNGGDTWQKLKSGVTVPLCRVLPLDEQRIVVVGDAGVLLTSSDSGKSWVRRRGAGKAEVEDVALGNDGRLYAITGGGQILISKNDGKSWTSEPSGARTHLWTIWPSPTGTLYMVGDNGTFVRKEGLDSPAAEEHDGEDEASAPAMKGAGAVELPATGKSFLFTGKLSSMTRAQAKAKTEELGGATKSSVTKDLDYLVVGDEGSPLYGQGKKGSKIVAAEKLIEGGAALRIISERTFLAMRPGK